MPTNKTESLIYTTIMCFFMVYFMSVYNIIINTGVSLAAFTYAWNDLPLAICTAFILDWFVVSTPAKKFAFKFINKDSSSLTKVLIISSCMIVGMVFFMSLFGALIHTGFTMEVFKLWMLNIPRNLIMALPLQLLIAGPIVRFVFRSLFPIGSIQDTQKAPIV